MTTTVKYRMIDSNIINVHDFGATGDGVTDDTQAFLNALAYNSEIKCNPGLTYRVTATLPLDDKHLHLSGSTVLADHDSQIFTLTSGSVRNATFDGNGRDHTSNVCEILPGTGAVIKNVTIKNCHGQTSFQTYALKFPMWGAYDFNIENVLFENITQDDDGAVTGKGFVGAVYFWDPTLGTQETTSRGTFKNITGKDIYSVDAGAGVVQDSDMIRCFWDNLNGDITDQNWHIDFDGVTSINVGKRVFKTGGLNGVIVRKVRCYKWDATAEDMYSVISLTNGSSRWTISDVQGYGDFARGIEMAGREHLIDNVRLESTASTTGYGLQVGATFGLCYESKITNVFLKGFNAATYFFDSVDCTVDGATFADNSLSVLTNNTSGGNINTVNNATCIGGPISVNGGAFMYLNNITIRDVALTATGYALNLLNGSMRIRDMLINANLSARRPVNLAIKTGTSVDMDNVTVIRNTANGAVQNDHCVFTTQDSDNTDTTLRVGRLRVVSNVNPNVGGSAVEGRQLVLFKNINYNVDKLEIENNAAVGSDSNDFAAFDTIGKCRLGKLAVIQNVSHSSINIANASEGTTISELELENGFNNNVACYVATAFLRDGAVLSNTLNTPTTITVV